MFSPKTNFFENLTKNLKLSFLQNPRRYLSQITHLLCDVASRAMGPRVGSTTEGIRSRSCGKILMFLSQNSRGSKRGILKPLLNVTGVKFFFQELSLENDNPEQLTCFQNAFFKKKKSRAKQIKKQEQILKINTNSTKEKQKQKSFTEITWE